MAAPALTTVERGRVSLLIYDFAFPGDELPLHTHDEGTAHITIVLRGSFIIIQPGLPPVDARAGDIYEFVAGQPHAIVAQEADSRLVNQITAKVELLTSLYVPPPPPPAPGVKDLI